MASLCAAGPDFRAVHSGKASGPSMGFKASRSDKIADSSSLVSYPKRRDSAREASSNAVAASCSTCKSVSRSVIRGFTESCPASIELRTSVLIRRQSPEKIEKILPSFCCASAKAFRVSLGDNLLFQISVSFCAVFTLSLSASNCLRPVFHCRASVLSGLNVPSKPAS